ncbi:tellurium resistance protein [Streptomyces sp. NBC_00091]|uniref:tellurium resistance protein n=1 Tax=Streptomyces sp. NBC_00091 TaxID=2975648 RepID=UPI00224E4095|nr:tellurium resistance protein [Streptomyces sp. NBC_00091]MCX5377977.1 tellurium resistance protein [Streptomyces sp. NBC_00091]
MSSADRPRGIIRLRAEAPAAHVLTKAAPQARIQGRGNLQANLNWLPTSRADIDLCCLVAFRDGSATVVQALGDGFGTLAEWPYVALDHDDRTGGSSDGETLRVNLRYRELFSRLVFFVYIYEGSADFRRLGAAVDVAAPTGPGCRILLDDSPAGAVGCTIASAVPEGDGLVVRREVTWYQPDERLSVHERVDRQYGFGLDWVQGRKPPLDGRR